MRPSVFGVDKESGRFPGEFDGQRTCLVAGIDLLEISPTVRTARPSIHRDGSNSAKPLIGYAVARATPLRVHHNLTLTEATPQVRPRAAARRAREAAG